MIEPTRAGDVVYFHYSGHGSEMPDNDGDELDGLDECLVPSDYVSRRDASGNLRDDTIAALLDELGRKQPGSVTLTFDCCYSGTATRGGRMLVRGQSWTGSEKTGSARTRAAAGATRSSVEGASGLVPAGHAATGNYVVLSATSEGQVANETDDGHGGTMGLFTHAFVKAAENAGPETTYRELHERLTNLMLHRNRKQTPQLEGERDLVLFGGTAIPAPAYFPVTLDRSGAIYLEAGSLQGMTEGSRFALFAAGTLDFQNTPPLARATLATVDLTYAQLELTPEFAGTVADSTLLAARAVEEVHHYGDNRLKVDLEPLAGKPAWSDLCRHLAGVPLLDTGATATRNWDVRLREGAPGELVLERQDGSALAERETGATVTERVTITLEGEARWRFLHALENQDPYAQVDIALRVVPVHVKRDARGTITGPAGDKSLPPSETGRIELPAGEFVMLELRNDGYVDAFVTVLDLRGDGRVGPLWPYPGARFKDNRVPADGAWHRMPPYVFRLSEPTGPEVFKAIATTEPADFSPLLDRDTLVKARERGERPSRSAGSPLGQFLQAATLGQRLAPTIDEGNWATATVTIEVGDEAGGDVGNRQ